MPHRSCLLALALLTGGAQAAGLAQAASPVPGAVAVYELDPARSRLDFEVRTRIGQRLRGEFPRYEGRVERLPGGQQRVRLRISTAAAEIPGKPRYTGWMRGESFFDTLRHPWMEFVSDPYPPHALAEGGQLHGQLTLRGATRPESLDVERADCAHPGLECEVRVRGDIARSRYGMDDWQVMLSERVRFTMHVWLREADPR